jgi:hypothetical protein
MHSYEGLLVLHVVARSPDLVGNSKATAVPNDKTLLINRLRNFLNRNVLQM